MVHETMNQFKETFPTVDRKLNLMVGEHDMEKKTYQ